MVIHFRRSLFRKNPTMARVAKALNIASSGACLQVEAPIPLGVELHWDQPGQKFHGYVRYCVYREIGYFVGVEFDASFKWSKKAFRPQHLLDLQTLVAPSKK